MMRTSTWITSLVPSGSTVPSCSTRSSFACAGSGISATSSSSSVPPSAALKRPSRRLTAPVNAPRSWPNSSASSSVSGNAAQLTATNGFDVARLRSCSVRATSSLPVPLSPVISTGASLCAIVSMRSESRSIGGLRPMIAAGLPFVPALRCEARPCLLELALERPLHAMRSIAG